MKKSITLTFALTALLLCAKASQSFETNSDLKLQLFNHASMLVEFDHVRYQNPTNTFCINDIEPGTHHLTIYKIRERGNHHYAQPVLVYKGRIQIPASSIISAVINPYHQYDVMNVIAKCNDPVPNIYFNSAPTPQYGMCPSEFESLKQCIENKSFDNTRLTIAKQALQSNDLTSMQIADLMNLMTFESTKLSLAKFAYRYTIDPENYYVLNDAFTFDSSIDELADYIQHNS